MLCQLNLRTFIEIFKELLYSLKHSRFGLFRQNFLGIFGNVEKSKFPTRDVQVLGANVRTIDVGILELGDL